MKQFSKRRPPLLLIAIATKLGIRERAKTFPVYLSARAPKYRKIIVEGREVVCIYIPPRGNCRIWGYDRATTERKTRQRTLYSL